MKDEETRRHVGDRTEFFGSQVGGESVISYSYTDLPWKLVAYDIKYFFTFAWALPWILWPVRPCDGGHFDELFLTAENIWCIFIHVVLFILQLLFLISLPIAFLLPGYLFIAALGLFFLVNGLLCRCLNGNTIIYESDPKYAPALPEHQHEQWVFLNGVAVGYVIIPDYGASTSLDTVTNMNVPVRPGCRVTSIAWLSPLSGPFSVYIIALQASFLT